MFQDVAIKAMRVDSVARLRRGVVAGYKTFGRKRQIESLSKEYTMRKVLSTTMLLTHRRWSPVRLHWKPWLKGELTCRY